MIDTNVFWFFLRNISNSFRQPFSSCLKCRWPFAEQQATGPDAEKALRAQLHSLLFPDSGDELFLFFLSASLYDVDINHGLVLSIEAHCPVHNEVLPGTRMGIQADTRQPQTKCIESVHCFYFHCQEFFSLTRRDGQGHLSASRPRCRAQNKLSDTMGQGDNTIGFVASWAKKRRFVLSCNYGLFLTEMNTGRVSGITNCALLLLHSRICAIPQRHFIRGYQSHFIRNHLFRQLDGYKSSVLHSVRFICQETTVPRTRYILASLSLRVRSSAPACLFVFEVKPMVWVWLVFDLHILFGVATKQWCLSVHPHQFVQCGCNNISVWCSKGGTNLMKTTFALGEFKWHTNLDVACCPESTQMTDQSQRGKWNVFLTRQSERFWGKPDQKGFTRGSDTSVFFRNARQLQDPNNITFCACFWSIKRKIHRISVSSPNFG